MAEVKKVPAAKLPAETRAALEASRSDVETAEAELEVLKKIGMDVSMLEEKLKWAKTTGETLLKEFG